ncbi:MAG: hypothetical protein EOP37_23710 [Rubrivivax sp.]|nr:MAG: hypothetical protein EOP37_23710 [Rubrivivax sp.]
MSIELQVKILNDLVEIMNACSGGKYEEMWCIFSLEDPDAAWSVETKFKFIRDGNQESEFLRDPQDRIADHVVELHRLMKAHTGGTWKSFELRVGPDGKAKTKFSY